MRLIRTSTADKKKVISLYFLFFVVFVLLTYSLECRNESTPTKIAHTFCTPGFFRIHSPRSRRNFGNIVHVLARVNTYVYVICIHLIVIFIIRCFDFCYNVHAGSCEQVYANPIRFDDNQILNTDRNT